MPLTAHDAEERSRQLIGAVIDAREQTGETGLIWRNERTPQAADAHIAALNALVNRQSELIAELTEQVRMALYPEHETPSQYERRMYLMYVNDAASQGRPALPFEKWAAVRDEVSR